MRNESDEGGSYSSHVFCHFRMRNSRMSYNYPTKIATPPPVPPRFSRSATFDGERATAEVKMSTSETQQTSSFIFYIRNWYERSSSSAGAAAFFGFHSI